MIEAREIKFRVWDKINKEWLLYEDYEDKGYVFVSRNRGAASSLQHCLDNPDMFAVMQYTGLKDKDGVEAYADVLIKAVDEILKVAWHFNRWVMVDIKGRIKEFRQIDQGFYKVIGNIHQHPELLEN